MYYFNTSNPFVIVTILFFLLFHIFLSFYFSIILAAIYLTFLNSYFYVWL